MEIQLYNKLNKLNQFQVQGIEGKENHNKLLNALILEFKYCNNLWNMNLCILKITVLVKVKLFQSTQP